MPSRLVIIAGSIIAAVLLIAVGFYAFGPIAPPEAAPTPFVVPTSQPAAPMSATQRILEASLSGFIVRLRSHSTNPELQLSNDEFLRAMTDVSFYDYAATVVAEPGHDRLTRRGLSMSDSALLTSIRVSLPAIPPQATQFAKVISCVFLSTHTAHMSWLEQRFNGRRVMPATRVEADVAFRIDPTWVRINGLQAKDILSTGTGSPQKDALLAAVGERLNEDPAGVLVSSITPTASTTL